MSIVYFLVIFLVLLLIYTVVSTITKLSLYLTTGTKYDNIRLFIPFILTVIVWSSLVPLCIFTINNYIGKNVFEEIMNLYLIKESLIPIFRPGNSYLIFIVWIPLSSFSEINVSNVFNGSILFPSTSILIDLS